MKKLIICLVLTSLFSGFAIAQWGPVTICSHGQSKQYNVSVTTFDGGYTSGVVTAWEDWRNSPTIKLFIQKINNDGNVQWTSNGIEVDGNLGMASGGSHYAQLLSDDAGGCIIVYVKNISGADYVYAARVNSSGSIQWTRSVSGIYGFSPRLTKSSANEFIVVYGIGYSIYAQKINFNGTLLWRDHILIYEPQSNVSIYPNIVSDGSGGAIINWLDNRNWGVIWDLYCQRVNSNGSLLWDQQGVLVFYNSADDDIDPLPRIWDHNMVVSSDGAIMTAFRTPAFFVAQVCAAKVKLDGSVPWGVNGYSLPCVQGDAVAEIVSDGADGACVFWEDYNNNSVTDIYGVRIDGEEPVPNLIWGRTQISEGLSGQTSHYLANWRIQNRMNFWQGNILIPWFSNNSSNLYFQVRQVTDGSPQLYFPSPLIVSGSASYSDFAASHVIGISYSTAVVTYRSSDNIFARGYPMSEPWEPESKYIASQNKELSIHALPNPFNPVTSISYNVPADNHISICVYNIVGQQVKVLVNNEFKQSGTYSITFNGENLSSGVYFVNIMAAGQTKLYKLLLLK